jgi:hypothetical protein
MSDDIDERRVDATGVGDTVVEKMSGSLHLAPRR